MVAKASCLQQSPLGARASPHGAFWPRPFASVLAGMSSRESLGQAPRLLSSAASQGLEALGQAGPSRGFHTLRDSRPAHPAL